MEKADYYQTLKKFTLTQKSTFIIQKTLRNIEGKKRIRFVVYFWVMRQKHAWQTVGKKSSYIAYIMNTDVYLSNMWFKKYSSLGHQEMNLCPVAWELRKIIKLRDRMNKTKRKRSRQEL